MRIVQVGDVAWVASSLTRALRTHATVANLEFAQRGATRSGLRKVSIAPARVVDAWHAARKVRSLRPDVVHIHWVPNAIVGLFVRVPWVLHIHGSDIRGLNRARRTAFFPLLKAASAVVYSTPDLRPWVHEFRPDAIYLPTPIELPNLDAREPRWDVMLASRAAAIKGAGVAFGGLARALARRPELRAIAVDGPLFEPIAERLPFGPKPQFLDHLARTRVVVGQFHLPSLGVSELEAMSYSRPVVSGADPELYEAPPPVRFARTADEVAEGILELLDEPARARQLGEEGRKWVEANFADAECASTLMSLYRTLAPHARA